MAEAYTYNKNYTLNSDNTAPAYLFLAVTPSDTVGDNFAAGPCRGLYVGTTGNVEAVGLDGTAVVFTAVPAGWILPIAAIRVNASLTTATNIVALF